MIDMKLKTGQSLRAYLDGVIKESIKTTLHQRGLQEKDAQDALSSTAQATSTNDGDDEAMQKGSVTTDDIIDKLNAIRAGHSFKDDKVRSSMEKYVTSLDNAERTALLAFLKGIAQIITGEISAADATEPSDHPANVKMEKELSAQKTKHVKPNVIKTQIPNTKKSGPSAEDTSAPVPITPKKG